VGQIAKTTKGGIKSYNSSTNLREKAHVGKVLPGASLGGLKGDPRGGGGSGKKKLTK